MRGFPAKDVDASADGVNPDSPFLGIHAVNVFVRDQDRSLRFYVEQLGFDVAFDARIQSGERSIAVAPPDGSTVLALIAPPPHSRAYTLIGRATGIVFVAEDLIAQFEECAYATLFFAEYDDKLQRLRYANCGHLPALLLRCDGTIDVQE